MTNQNEKERFLSQNTSDSNNIQSQARSIDERLAEMEKNSVSFSDTKSTNDTESNTLMTPTVAVTPTPESSTQSLSTPSIHTQTETVEKISKAVVAFGLGGLIGALITSLLI